MNIAITGSRKLEPRQAGQAHYELWDIWHHNQGYKWHVGDATGIDALARATCDRAQLHLHRAEGRQPWQLQQRSMNMINAIVSEGTLHAFVNKPCPAGLTLTSWQGSGTWGTVRYAVSRGVPVELHWLIDEQPLPDWLEPAQLKLF